MSIAWTNEPVVYMELDASSHLTLMTDLDAAFGAAGWSSTTITDGKLYLLESPQELVAKVRMWIDTSNSLADDYVSIRVESADGARVGLNHWLSVGSGRELQVVAGICQFFISRPGSSEDEGDNAHNMVCGGILKVPEADCGGIESATVTTECWWSNADRRSNAGHAFFRNLRNHRYAFHTSSACRNGDYVDSTTSVLDWYPRLFVPTPPMDVDYWEGYLASRVRWHDLSPLFFDPLFGWGNAAYPARLMGSLWDSMAMSIDSPLDFVGTFDGQSFINFSHSDDATEGRGTFFSSLMLLKDTPAEAALGNVAY